MSTNTILFGVLFFLVGMALFLLIRLERRLRKLFLGSKAANLETHIADIVQGVKMLSDRSEKQAADLGELAERIQKEGRGVKLVRFNPFTDVGGNHSFAVAIVNSDGDGVVFSSLYSRERMSVFA